MLFHALLLLALTAESFSARECSRRDYDTGSVCVCNATYCDTIPQVEKIASPQFYIYTSSKNGLRFKQETGEFKNGSSNKNAIVINVDKTFQPILGWGGAFTDATGINIASLEEEAENNLMQSYFSDQGIEYSLCRAPIGGTDFSTRGYSYDDGDADPALNNFALTDDDWKYKIRYMQYAKNLTNDNLRFFASAWTAPKWMKTNNEYYGNGYLKEDMYQAWADYFVKFLDQYKEEGLEFWGITTGNEPNTAFLPVEINSVGWTPETMGKWILENLGPTIRNSSYSDIKIMILDDQRLYLPWYVEQALTNPEAEKYIDGIAFHWYINPETPVKWLSDTHDIYPDKFILSTEACNVVILNSDPVVLGSWDRGEYYSHDIIRDLENWVGGWIDWNMVLDLSGGPTYISNFVDSPVIVNASAGEFYKQPMFYHLGHFSKFVPRDSIRVEVTSELENIDKVAFRRPDNGTVLVVLNSNDEAVEVTVVDESRGSAILNISERSITTIIYW